MTTAAVAAATAAVAATAAAAVAAAATAAAVATAAVVVMEEAAVEAVAVSDTDLGNSLQQASPCSELEEAPWEPCLHVIMGNNLCLHAKCDDRCFADHS